MCIRDRYQRRVRGLFLTVNAHLSAAMSTKEKLDGDVHRVEQEYRLKRLYHSFASFGDRRRPVRDRDCFAQKRKDVQPASELDSTKFMKLCRDCGLISPQFNRNDVDFVFLQAVPKGQRKMSYDHFEVAVSLMAERIGVPVEMLVARLSSASMTPAVSGTKAEPNRFHDDKSTYTGVYARGGPSLVEHRRNVTENSKANVEWRDTLRPGME
eukprot:TRINITY_DN11229_c0_g1_i6.p1 TRINITY_DN11229_c0_g1~~TRINITY_DN11229_c0_g1_i6.p1  ORF type:complete len:211 (-),score=38.14 TRINITY_DN11229_c0_g1_i6:360-992(-)